LLAAHRGPILRQRPTVHIVALVVYIQDAGPAVSRAVGRGFNRRTQFTDHPRGRGDAARVRRPPQGCGVLGKRVGSKEALMPLDEDLVEGAQALAEEQVGQHTKFRPLDIEFGQHARARAAAARVS